MRFTLLALLLFVAPAFAERVPSRKAAVPVATGARGDITVPYLTNGFSTLGVANGVGPRIFSDPILSTPAQPMLKPVFNLPFYGARLGPSSGMVGAASVQPNILRPRR